MDESRNQGIDRRGALAPSRRGRYVRALALADQLTAAAPDNPVVRAIRAQALLKSDAGEDAVGRGPPGRRAGPRTANRRRRSWASPPGVRASSRLRSSRWSGRSSCRGGSRACWSTTPGSWRPSGALGRPSRRPPKRSARPPSRRRPGPRSGLAQFRLHRRQEAEASLRKALESGPQRPLRPVGHGQRCLQDKRQDKQAVALTHLLEETPGTEQIVAGVRQEAKRRQVAKKLVERNALPGPGLRGDGPPLGLARAGRRDDRPACGWASARSRWPRCSPAWLSRSCWYGSPTRSSPEWTRSFPKTLSDFAGGGRHPRRCGIIPRQSSVMTLARQRRRPLE